MFLFGRHILHTALKSAKHTESDKNGLAIQKSVQVCGPYFQQIQCFLGPSMYPI